MPWEVERSRDTVIVRVSGPMEDWDGLMRHLPQHLHPMPRAVVLPVTIPGGNGHDARMLQTLWASLMDAGVPIQREVKPEPP